MKIIFLMGGEGRRFDQRVNLPKPLIKLNNIELIKWAVNSYNFIGYYTQWSDVYFITRSDHIRNFGIDKFLKSSFSADVNIRYVEETTRGPAETALVVKDDINPEEQAIVSDCDMFFNSLPLFKEALNIRHNDSVYGILPYVKREDKQNAWSYCALDENSAVIKVNEKDYEMFNAGCPGIVGAYTFNRWRYFTEEAEVMIKDADFSGEEKKKEFYISRIFQRFISKGHLVKGVDVAPSWILGTPGQFLAFENFLKGTDKPHGNR